MWSNVLIGVFTLILIFVVYLRKIKRKYSSIAHIPGPKGLFLLGNALDMGANPVEVLINIQNLFKKYGKYVQIWIGPHRPTILVSDVKFLEYILSSTKHIEKSENYRFLHPWLGNGLIVSTGEKWRKRRKFITPAFHFKVLEQFVEVFNKNGTILIEKLSKEVNKESVDIYPFITLFTLDIISETAMDISINAQQNSNSKYVQAVQVTCKNHVERTFSAWKQIDLLYRFSEASKIFKQSLEIIHGFSRKVIAEKRKELMEEETSNQTNEKEEEVNNVLGVKKRMAFLELLLRTIFDGEKMFDEDIREEVDTFMFAGHDTTSSAVSFTLYEIAKHPEIQHKLVEEVYSVLGDDKNKQPTYQELMSLKYLELVIKESLRLYPSIPYYSRKIQEDFVFDGVTFPAGLRVSLCPIILHRDPEIYEDPDKFIPERFLPENMRQKSPYAYLPFSAGLRNCIGQKFAMLEMKATISRILLNFEISNVPTHKLVLSTEMILKSASGIHIRLKNRESK